MNKLNKMNTHVVVGRFVNSLSKLSDRGVSPEELAETLVDEVPYSTLVWLQQLADDQAIHDEILDEEEVGLSEEPNEDLVGVVDLDDADSILDAVHYLLDRFEFLYEEGYGDEELHELLDLRNLAYFREDDDFDTTRNSAFGNTSFDTVFSSGGGSTDGISVDVSETVWLY